MFDTNPLIAYKKPEIIKMLTLNMLISVHENSFRKLSVKSYTLISSF